MSFLVRQGRTIRLEDGWPSQQDLDRLVLLPGGDAEDRSEWRWQIDVRATLQEKLGQDMEPYVILGTCNPQLAHRALAVEREIGLLLPCNVVVRAADGTTLVQALDPQVMINVPERSELQPIADDAARRIKLRSTACPR